MWIMMSGCFLSIVHKDCKADELLVRARRSGDIEKVFPTAVVERTPSNDYLFRARVKRTAVAAAISRELRGIRYGNFKSSVRDSKLHDAYVGTWHSMARVQNPPPYSGQDSLF